jgi:transposase-like protein
MDTVKVENSTFVRDIHSKAILNTDKKGLSEYLMQKEIAKKKNTESEDAKKRLAVIEQDMQEIKRLLVELNSMRNVNGN